VKRTQPLTFAKDFLARPGNRRLFWIVLAWQVLLYCALVGGIMGSMYGLLGVDWNSTGIVNILTTFVGFLLLELPAIIALSALLGKYKRWARETGALRD
jgi:hypothetical protein